MGKNYILGYSKNGGPWVNTNSAIGGSESCPLFGVGHANHHQKHLCNIQGILSSRKRLNYSTRIINNTKLLVGTEVPLTPTQIEHSIRNNNTSYWTNLGGIVGLNAQVGGNNCSQYAIPSYPCGSDANCNTYCECVYPGYGGYLVEDWGVSSCACGGSTPKAIIYCG